MQTHRARARQAILVIGLLLLIIAAALINASIASGQGPPVNKVWLPTIQNGPIEPKLEIVFLEDPGIYWKVTPVNSMAAAWSSVYYTQDGASRYTAVSPVEMDQWYYTPLVHQWPGVYRINRWIRVNGVSFRVLTFRIPPAEMAEDVQLYDPH